MSAGKIYNIAPGVPFAKALARELLSRTQGAPEALSSIRVLLPTRRACRVLQDAFLSEHDGGALLLPHMQPLADVDEEELSLVGGGAAQVALPPAIAPLRRQILLARLVMAREDFRGGFDQALALAKSLGALMDQIYTENLDMADLVTLVPEEFADHWQITLSFLEILSDAWPKILAEEGVIDGADRRNRLILSLAQHWTDHPPQGPVIAAGTTGSIPATAALLKAVLGMPAGEIVLPGLDQGMDGPSWEAMDETHPQFGMRQLLERLERGREDVQDWRGSACEIAPRIAFAREVMRPAETSGQWMGLSGSDFAAAFEGLSFYECDHEAHEAAVVGLALRGALEEEGARACLITPDRVLARRVAAFCKRWGVEVDDSGGDTLLRSALGAYLLLILKVCSGGAGPKDVLALCHHSYMRGLDGVEALDIALRGLKPAAGFEGLRAHIKQRERLAESVRLEALACLDVLEGMFSAFYETYGQGGRFSFLACLKAHLVLAESLAAGSSGRVLWQGADGEVASEFFAALLQQAAAMPDMDIGSYEGALAHLMQGVKVRPAYGVHPRLQILGQLEARMVDADVVVLSGLNEGVWPPDAGADPWMSRPMRKEFGLPSPERGVGLAAHDFVQGFCAPRVVVTRSKRSGSAPSVPSRWLQRLDAVMQAAEIGPDVFCAPEVLEWARGLDVADDYAPEPRPAPTPPVSARPRRLPVTQIETWLRDPYSVYARYVLDLRALDDVEKPLDAAVRGDVLHGVLERFVKAHPLEMPHDAGAILHGLAHEALEEVEAGGQSLRFWQAKLESSLEWFEGQERQWREAARPIATEVRGEVRIQCAGGGFMLHGTADRIDKLADVSAGERGVVIDYKSGGAFPIKRIAGGDLPQLPLEALILRGGGFDGVPAMESGVLSYWVMNGQVRTLDEGVDDLLRDTEENLQQLIECFDDEDAPYLSLPRSDKLPRFSDYVHLARVQEWAALDDETGDASAQEAA